MSWKLGTCWMFREMGVGDEVGCWRTVDVNTAKLGKIARIDRVSISPDKIKSGTLYLGLEHIESGGTILTTQTVGNGELKSSKFVFNSEHLLYGKLRPYLAKIAAPDFDGVCSTDIIPILPGPELDREFLLYFLRQNSMVEYATSRASGANLPRLSPNQLSDFEIPLPPLAEQKRIARILDYADALRAKRRETIKQLDALVQSVFLDMFGDPVTNPRGWDLARIGDLGIVVTGNTPSRKQANYYGDYIEWIKSDNIDAGNMFIQKATEGLSELGVKVARTVPPGAILVTCIAGSPNSIGNCAMTDRTVAFNQQINGFIPDESVQSTFVLAMFRVGKKLIQRASTNSMKGMVSKRAFQSIQIPVPPMNLQKRYGSVVKRIQRLQQAIEQSYIATADLFSSLQSRAFNGEL